MANIYNKKLNLLFEYEQKIKLGNKEKNKKKSFRNILIVISAGMLISIGLIYYMINMMYTERMNELEEARDKLLDPILGANSAEASMYESQLDELDSRLEAIETAIAGVGKLPDYKYLKEDFIRDLLSVCEDSADIVSIALSDTEVTLSVNVERVEQASEFVMRLEEKGLFADVKYSGFTNQTPDESELNDSETVPEDEKLVNFTLQCVFSEVDS